MNNIMRGGEYMPYQDGSGPAGQGPLTGRGMGPCGGGYGCGRQRGGYGRRMMGAARGFFCWGANTQAYQPTTQDLEAERDVLKQEVAAIEEELKTAKSKK